MKNNRRMILLALGLIVAMICLLLFVRQSNLPRGLAGNHVNRSVSSAAFFATAGASPYHITFFGTKTFRSQLK